MRKNTNIMKRAGAAIAAAALTVSMAVPTMAARYSAEIGGTKTQSVAVRLDKLEGINVPDETFSFTLVPGTADSSNGISAGLTGTATIDDVTFTNTDFTAQAPISVSKNISLDFGRVQFSKPGVYRYTLTQTSDDGNRGITADNTAARTVDVYVVDDSSETENKLKIDTIVAYKTTVPTSTSKTEGYANTYTAYNYIMELKVAGNQGDKSAEFATKFEIKSAVPGTYKVKKNTGEAAALTIDENGKATYGGDSFKLVHGDTVTIEGLPVGAKIQPSIDATGYTVSAIPEVTISSATGAATANNSTITISKTGTIPTGVIMVVAPFALFVLVGGFGMILMSAKRRRQN